MHEFMKMSVIYCKYIRAHVTIELEGVHKLHYTACTYFENFLN